MNKPEFINKKNAKNTLALAAAALAVVGSEQTASAKTPNKPAKTSEVFPATQKHLKEYLESNIQKQEAVSFFHGTLVIKEAKNTGGVEARPNHTGGAIYLSGTMPATTKYIANPIVENLGAGTDVYDDASITRRTYFGSLTQDERGKVHVHLHRFNPNTMQLVADDYSDEPLGPVVFQCDKAGTINLEQPFSSLDGRPDIHGGPLNDPAGNPIPIGYEYEAHK
jgi:hypothetical protein